MQSKFNVSKDKSNRTFEDIVFDSAVEMTYYRDYLLPKIENGEIISCLRQVKYELQPSFLYRGKKQQDISYISDFDILYASGKFEVIDVKGMVKPMDNIKRKMFHYRYPNIELVWIGKSDIDGGYVPLEVIKDGRKSRKKAKEMKKNKLGEENVSNEIKSFLDAKNYNISNIEYINIIRSSSQVHVKYEAFQQKYRLWTTDGYEFLVTVYYAGKIQ